MEHKNKLPTEKKTLDKDLLSQDDLNHNLKTFKKTNKPHAALESPEGKNNGAEPVAFAGLKKWQI